MKKIDRETELKVIELYVNKKINSTVIAKDLGVSFNSVVRIVKRNGYKTRKTADVNRGTKHDKCVSIESVMDLYVNESKSSMEIAIKLGCSDVTVLNILKENNVTIRKNSFYSIKPFDENEAKKLYENGYSIRKIANKLNSSDYCIGNFLRKNGLNKPENSYILNRGKKIPKESCVRMGDTKRKNKELGLYDHIYLKKTGLTYKEFQKQLPAFKSYLEQVRSITNKQSLKTLFNFEKREKMGIDGAYNLDHKYSIIEGFKNNIPPQTIGHIANLEMLPWKDNLSKQGNCSITLQELKKLIKNAS